jgi:5-formyltetrahydrofolate cyclo-ligase
VTLSAGPNIPDHRRRRTSAAQPGYISQIDRNSPQEAKQRVRERIWRTLENEGAARFPGARGRIPNFRGAEAAAERLAELPEWEAAGVVKSNPDAPQLPVRRRARRDRKTLYMAVPRLAEDEPFVRVVGDPTIKKALAEGIPARAPDLGHVDLVVCGTVAVNRAGVRVGKGGGYSDLEMGLLVEAGLVDDATTIVTTVHPLQLLDEELPEAAHDFRVDIVVTEDDVVHTHARLRSPGVLWEHLDDETIEGIPVLAARRVRQGSRAS